MEPKETRLVTLAQLASRLRVNPSDLRLEVEAGRLPAVRLGRRGLLFDPELVERILGERASMAPSQETRP